MPNECQATDYPLNLNRKCDPELIRELDFPITGKLYAEALSGIIGALLVAAEAGRWVAYSRNHNWYVGRCRYSGPAFTYTNVLGAIAFLDGAGVIEDQRAKRASFGRQSRMRALPALLEAGRSCTFHHHLREPLRLKDSDGNLISYRDTAQTLRLRREIHWINRGVAEIEIELPGVTRTPNHILLDSKPILVTPRPRLHRVFLRKSWRCGGRAYGWWQGLPGQYRDQLLLNGEPVVRPDYCALHGQMLYAERGIPFDGDVYEVGRGFSRDEGKRAFLIAVNAKGRRNAVAAISKNLRLDWCGASALLEAVKERNQPIADAFGSDRGIHLMRLDSEIILACVATCVREGIPALPVHDELVVPARYGSRAAEIMTQTFESLAAPVSPCQVRLKAPTVLHVEECCPNKSATK